MRLFKKNLFSVCLLITIFSFASCKSTNTLTIRKIKADYPLYFGSAAFVDKDSVVFAGFSKKLNEEHILADFFEKDQLFVNYLLNRATAKEFNCKPYLATTDSLGMQNDYIAFLRQDTVFEKTFLSAVHTFLSAKKGRIKGFKPLPSINISDDSLATLAARFFYANNIQGDNIRYQVLNFHASGHRRFYSANACVLIEAFIYAVLTENIYNPLYPFRAELETNMKNISLLKTNLSDDKLLLYARQEMYNRMAISSYIRSLLLDLYMAKKHVYGFAITK